MERAAVWYVGAFAALGSVLLAGVSIAGVDWNRARYPLWAVAVAGTAVLAAFTVVTLASRVIAPACSSMKLMRWEEKAQARLQKKNKGAAVSWQEVAAEDKRVLRALLLDEAAFNAGPKEVWQRAKTGSAADLATIRTMVETADSWLARRRFIVLRFLTPVAAIVILAAALAWKPLTTNLESVTPAQPAPVTVELAPTVDPAQLIGANCTLRMLDGVAIAGSLNSSLTVAFAAQGDCPAAVVNLTPNSATIQTR